jgi:signal transduction histidine kinase
MTRDKREILYSIVVFVTVPALMLASTLIFYSSIRHLYNEDIRRKANLANTVIAETLRSDINQQNNQALDQKLTDIKNQASELVKLAVYYEKDNLIKIMAKTNDVDTDLSDSTSLQVKIVIDRQESIAKLENVLINSKTEQVWTVSTPLIDSSTHQVIAVVNSSLSTAKSDQLITDVLKLPLIFGVASVVVVLALLFRHLRFVEYARLLTRQKEINQTMSDFLSVATHELKTPTTIIKGYISNAMEEESNTLAQSTKDQLQVALNQTDRLNNLVQDLLNVSRIEQGRVSYKMQNVVLAEVITPIVENYRLIAKDKNLEINYQPDPSLIVWADSGRVQEIFSNLIDNAVKYSQKGTINILHQNNEKTITTSVRDSGIGMSAEQRKRLFQRFYRVQTDQTKDISGTGLGLWIIKQYIVAMGGEISVDSMTGVGTEFTVALLKSNT